jgi:DNA-binding response OmpR family regulator
MGKKVLVVDDESSLRRMVAFALMQRGYEPELCETGMKGLQALEASKRDNTPLDFAIVDVRLPDMDGLDLLKAIKANYPTIPVVIITGHGREQISDEVTKADAFLEKPFDMDELAKILDEMPEPKAQDVSKGWPQIGQTYSAYVLVTLNQDVNLMDVYRRLIKTEKVVFCDVVRGEDLMALVQAESPEKIKAVIEEKIKTIEGVADVASLSVDAPLTADNVGDIIAAVDEAGGPEETQLRSRLVMGLIDFLDVLRDR